MVKKQRFELMQIDVPMTGFKSRTSAVVDCLVIRARMEHPPGSSIDQY